MSQFNLELLQRLKEEAEEAEKLSQEGRRELSSEALSLLHIAELPSQPLVFQFGLSVHTQENPDSTAEKTPKRRPER